jgi:WD40 repeat protein
MKQQDCPPLADLRRLLSGELSEREAGSLEQHFLGCPHCAGRAQELEAEVEPRPSPAWEYPRGELIERLVSRLEALSVSFAAANPPEGSPARDTIPQRVSVQTPFRFGPAEDNSWPEVPGYEVLEELGRGGMGVVYKARQVGLGRLVALKMILAGQHAGAEHLSRFQVEAEAVARLRHPNIVQIYEVGRAGTQPFLSLEFCPGGNLADRLREGPLPPERAAQLLEQVALAVQAAHEAEVIHRDLKPGNILLVREGASPEEFGAKVTDFGLAKRLDVSDGQTQTGDLLGTPSFMAPEQAEGRLGAVGPATDVYALGAILYECITGKPPFKGSSIRETLELVCQADPVPPRQLQPKCPRDLETICLKCLRKEPHQRYASAKDLADDLERYRNNEPIRARPVPPWEYAWKWVRRRPGLAAVSAVCLLAFGALLALGFSWSASLGVARGALEAEVARADAAESARLAEETRASAARQLAQTHEFFGLLHTVAKRSARPEPGWTWANLADLGKAGRLPPAAEHLVELRNEAATALGEVDVRLSATVTPEVLGQPFELECLAFHPQGRYLAVGQSRAVGFAVGHVALLDPDRKASPRLLPFPASAFVQSVLQGSQEGVRSLAFSPDGRWLVAGTNYGQLHCWDLSVDPPTRRSRPAHADRVDWLGFSPDGSALFSAGRDRTLKRWSFPDLQETASDRQKEPFGGLTVHPTEGWVCCSREKIRSLSGEGLRPLRPDWPPGCTGLCFSPRGDYLLISPVNRLILLAAPEGFWIRELAAPGATEAHDGFITSLSFSPDSRLILSGTREPKQVRLWETASGRLLADIPIRTGTGQAAFHPDGRSFAVLARKEVRFYEIRGRSEQTSLAPRSSPVLECAIHPDGRSLACLSRSYHGPNHVGEASLWPLVGRSSDSPSALLAFPRNAHWLRQPIALHPTSPVLAFHPFGALALWGPQGQKTLGPVPAPHHLAALGFGPDGRLWAAVDAELQVRELSEGRVLARWSSQAARIRFGGSNPNCVAVGRRWVAAGADNGLVYLLRAPEVRGEAMPQVADNPVRSVALTADETVAAAGTDTGEVCLIRVPGGEVLARLPAHRDRITAVAFSGNRLLATGSRDHTVRLWQGDGAGWREVITLSLPAPVRWLAFHPDGIRLFVLLDQELAVRVWHLDRLRTQLTELGLGEGLEVIETRPLPPPASEPPPIPPATEPPAGPNGLKAELFTDMYLQRCVKVRYDPQVLFDWKDRAPDPLLPKEFFSGRWTGWLKAPRAGRYTLRLETNAGARLWLDGILRMDLWKAEVPQYQVEVDLSAGPHALRVEYFQVQSPAYLRLLWAPAGGSSPEPVPAWALFHDRATAEKVAVPPPVR